MEVDFCPVLCIPKVAILQAFRSISHFVWYCKAVSDSYTNVNGYLIPNLIYKLGKKYSEKEKTSLDSPSPKLNKSMIAYHETGDLFADTCEIVESAQSIAYAAVDTILVQRNWLLGKRIAIECLNENGKADYGKKTMKKLSSELKEKYGKGFDFSSLYKYVKFHQEFPQILDSLRPKSGRPLSWTHYRILLRKHH